MKLRFFFESFFFEFNSLNIRIPIILNVSNKFSIEK